MSDTSSTPHVQGLSPFSHTMGELVRRELRTIDAKVSVAEAARCMTEEGIGSLVVLEQGQLAGIVTKSDLVSRVLVPAQEPSLPIGEVLTRDVVTVDGQQSIFDGLLLMIQHGIGHLVVVADAQPVGVVSERDWLTFQERHPAALFRRMDAADSIERLAELRARANRSVQQLFQSEGSAEALTRFITEINDRVARRVIALCLASLEAESGPAPAAFAWMALGSEGREEQTLSTDQDNALVFADVPQGEVARVQAWFLKLASRVVDGLDVCGFPRCKGNVMASNPDLCRPLRDWQHRFSGYLTAADPEALLQSSIYFDFRCLYGDSTLVDALWKHLLERMQTERGFLRHLAADGHEGRPPVRSPGWRLRRWLGLPLPALDLKKQGLSPLTAAARVLALSAGVTRSNTLERLRAAEQAEVLPASLAQSAMRAYDLLMLLRVRQHLRQQSQGEDPTNVLTLATLDPLQRRILIDALKTVLDLQDHAATRFGSFALG